MYVDYGKVSFEKTEDGKSYFEKAQNGEVVLDDNVLEVKDFSVKDLSKIKANNLLVYNFPLEWGKE